MDGLFDDLIPKQSAPTSAGGMFDDLMPSKRTPKVTVGEVEPLVYDGPDVDFAAALRGNAPAASAPARTAADTALASIGLGDALAAPNYTNPTLRAVQQQPRSAVPVIAPQRSRRELADLGVMTPEAAPTTLGQDIFDTALGIREGARNVTSATLGLPVNWLNAVNHMGNVAADSLAGIFGQDAEDVAMMEQPAWIRGIQDSLRLKNTEDAEAYASDLLLQQRAQMADKDAVDSFDFLLNNPGALVDVGAQQVGQVLNVIPGAGKVGNIAAGALSAGAQNADQVAEELRARFPDMPEQEVQRRAAEAFTVSTLANAILPNVIEGGSFIERGIGGEIARGQGGLGRQVAQGLIGEGLSGAGEEASDQLVQNVALGDPLTQGVGQAALLGTLLEGPLGGVAGAGNYFGDRRQSGAIPDNTNPPAAQPQQGAPAHAQQPSTPPGAPAPAARPASAPAQPSAAADVTVAPEPTADLDAMLGHQVAPPQPEAAPAPARTPPPVLDEQRIADALGAAPEPTVMPPAGLKGQAAPAEAQPTIPAAAARSVAARAPRPATKSDKAGKPLDLLRVIAASGGLNRAAWQRQGVDPAEFTRRAGFNYVFRKQGGMTPSDLREFMQQEGYLPADMPDRPAEVDDNDAIDMFDRAFRGGEEIYSPDQQEAVARWREGQRQDEETARAEWEAAHGSSFDEWMASEPAMPDGFEPDHLDRAIELGATQQEVYDALAAGGDAIRALADRLESSNEQADTGAADEREAVRGLQADEARGDETSPGRVDRGPAGLFPEPIAREEIDAERRRRDERRDGKTSTGRTDMTAGEGELFAGPRPEQDELENAADVAEESRRQGDEDSYTLGLREAIDDALGDAAARVEYVHDTAGLPAATRARIESNLKQRDGKGKTAAVYVPKTGKVYILTGTTATPRAAVWNAMHEIAGHHGLRTLLGDKLDGALEIAQQNPTVAKVADAITRQRKLRPEQRLLAVEEALAELAASVRTDDYSQIEERYNTAVPQGIRASVRTAVENFIRRLTKLLRDKLGRNAEFTDADVRSLLEAAWQAANDSQASEATGAQEALEALTPQQAEQEAESRRNEAATTLPVSRGTAGWNYDESGWEGVRGTANRARAELQDKMRAWDDVQKQIESQLAQALPDAQNVYRMENLMHGRVGEAIKRLENEQVKPLLQAMRKAGVDLATLEEYLYARHAKERNAQIATINPAMPDGGSGMTNADADAILSKANAKKLDPLARMVDKVTRETRRRMLSHGLLTQEQFDAMDAQYRHFVPLRGRDTKPTDIIASGTGSGRGLDTRSQPVKRALGRGSRAKNLIAEVIGDAQRSIILAEKARVGRSVMRIVLANPNQSLWQVEPVQTERALDANGEVYERVVNDWSDPSVVAVRHNGKLYKVQINSEPLAKALTGIGVDQLDAITRAAGKLNRYFSAVLTQYNPAFVPVNATRDALFGLTGLAAEHGESAALDAAMHYPQAAVAAYRLALGNPGTGQWAQWAQEFAEHGGKTGYVNMPSVEELAGKIGKGGLTSYSPTGLARVANVVAEQVSNVNEAVENALRLSAYVTMRKRGWSEDKAAAYAKDLTVNFNRKGFQGSRLNAWFLFYNAGLQGAKRTADVMRRPKAWTYVGMFAAAQVAAMMAMMGMKGDDDDDNLWDKVPEHVKRRNLVIPVGKDAILTVPMPYGFNWFTYMAGRIGADVMRKDEPANDRAAAITADGLSALTEAFSPVPLEDGALGLLPTALRIPVNVQTNRDDFGRQIRKEDAYAKSDVPRASMGRADTLELFKMTAKGLNRIGGGDDFTPPAMSAFDVAPEDIEYLLKAATGGAGKFIVDTATLGQQVTGGNMTEDVALRDVPITSRFATNVDEQAAQASLYYSRREVVDRGLKRVRAEYKARGADEAEKLMHSLPELKGAAFKRRKKDSKNGEAGSVIEVNGSPQFVAIDEGTNRGEYGRVSNPKPLSVFAAYKAAEEAGKARNDEVEAAYARAPASVLPTDSTRRRDASLRTADRIRQAAHNDFNRAWVRDVVGTAE